MLSCMEICVRRIFVYTELTEVVNVMVVGISRDEMIRIIKRSLYGVTLCKKRFQVSPGKIFVSLEKQKLSKPEFMRDTSEFDWSKNGNIFDWHRKRIYGMFCFEISWYCLNWCWAYEIVLGKSWENLGVVLPLLFYHSHHRRPLLQSMQN